MKQFFKIIMSFLMAFSMIFVFSSSEVEAKEYSFGCDAYELAWVNDEGNFETVACYGSFAEAKAAMTQDDYVVRHADSKSPTKIIAIKSGIAISYPRRNGSTTLNVYQHQDYVTEKGKYKDTYVTQHRELFQPDTVSYNGNGEGNVKLVLQGFEGYAKLSGMDLVPMKFIEKGLVITLGGQTNDNGVPEYPFEMIPKMSHYSVVQNGSYKDFVYTYYSGYDGKAYSLTIGPAADWMAVGQTYYSKDGYNFYADRNMSNYLATYYSYYVFLPLRSRSNIQGSTLDAYLASKGFTEKPVSTSTNDLNERQSQLAGEGQMFVDSQNVYGVNALLTYAMACNESGYGRSTYAVSKNNLFGWSAVDSNPDNATYFNSVATGIQEQMAYNLRGYLDIFDVRYFGMHLGNKESGFNVKYASDPYWGYKIAAIAYDIDKFSNNYDGSLSDDVYSLGLINTFQTPYYRTASTSSEVMFTSEYSSQYQKNHIVIVNGETNGFYQVQSPNAILSDGTILKNKVSGVQQPASSYDFARSIGFISADKVTLLNEFDHTSIPGQTPEGEFVFALSDFSVNAQGILTVSGTAYRPGIYITQMNQIVHTLNVFDEFYDQILEKRMVTALKDNTQDQAHFNGTLDLNELEDGKYYFRFNSDYSSFEEYCDTRVISFSIKSVETDMRKYTFELQDNILWLTVETKAALDPLDYEHLSLLKEISINDDSVLYVKGISLVKSLNHDQDKIVHQLIAKNINSDQTYSFVLNSSQGDYNLTNVYKDGYSYDYGWFEGNADLHGLPAGNYVLYINTTLEGMSFSSKLYGKSSAAESEMILGKDGLYRQLQMRYGVSYRAEIAVTRYTYEKEEKQDLPRIREGYQNLISFKYDEDSNSLNAIGTAFIWNGMFSKNSNVSYTLMALNMTDGSVYEFMTEGTNLYLGKSPLWNNTELYGEGFDYEYTWYSINVPINQLTSGEYEFVMKIETNDYIEYLDLKKSADSGLADFENKQLHILGFVNRNDKNKVQMTLVKHK